MFLIKSYRNSALMCEKNVLLLIIVSICVTSALSSSSEKSAHDVQPSKHTKYETAEDKVLRKPEPSIDKGVEINKKAEEPVSSTRSTTMGLRRRQNHPWSRWVDYEKKKQYQEYLKEERRKNSINKYKYNFDI